MIVGTAGHIDHGKTTLVQALTGVDTDRLPEEKKRGITIELGYASLPVEGGEPISFVDVPGHEKLVRTMVAGACGLDVALLLLAADDGVMPQTREHLSILSLLGIAQGAVVITKIDRVESAQVVRREQEARVLLEEHGLSGYDVIAVSSHTGAGIESLQSWLRRRAADLAGQGVARADANRGFRMGLDRAFTLDGIGTVVAGSVMAGHVVIGESLCLAHASTESWRVRSLHTHGRAVEQAGPGRRLAVGLAGLERSAVQRGQMLCHPDIAHMGSRLDVSLRLSPGATQALRSGTRVHVHLASQEVMASVALLGQTSLEPGESCLAQLVLAQPLPAWMGDAFVLRDASATRTVAGGVVLDPEGPVRYRQTEERLAQLQGLQLALQQSDPAQLLRAVLAHAPWGMNGRVWLRRGGWLQWSFDPAAMPDVVFAQQGEWVIAADRLRLNEALLLKALADFHRQWPEDMGPDIKRARRLTAPRMPEALWQHLVDKLVSESKLGRRGQFLHLPSHGEQLRASELVVAQRVLPLLREGRFDPPWVRDLSGTARIPEPAMRSVLVRLAKAGEVYQVVKDLFYHPAVVQDLANLIRDIFARDGVVEAAAFRDATGLGRKRAIQILEFFDRVGFTLRVGDQHVLRAHTTLFPRGGTS
jgi:selenocysteine-specific elongation factor